MPNNTKPESVTTHPPASAPTCKSSPRLRAQIQSSGTLYKIQAKNQPLIKRGVAVNNGPLKATNNAGTLHNDAAIKADSYHLPDRRDFHPQTKTRGVTRITGPISAKAANNCAGLKIDNEPRWAETIVFFFNDAATTEIYTLSLHDALPI